MKLRKWNVSLHKYEEIEIPDNWNCKSYSNDMNEIVTCPQCGKKLKFGETYTSLEIHTNIGFGYGVCQECYDKEWERRKNEKYE